MISPLSAFYGGYVANAGYLPFVQVASASSTTPYSAASAYATTGPFNNQIGNAVTFAPDAIFVDAINT